MATERDLIVSARLLRAAVLEAEAASIAAEDARLRSVKLENDAGLAWTRAREAEARHKEVVTRLDPPAPVATAGEFMEQAVAAAYPLPTAVVVDPKASKPKK